LSKPCVRAYQVQRIRIDHQWHVQGERALGAGEGSQGPAVGAIANAFAHATGKRIRDLPMNPQRVKATLG
jgi:CO/xanthine dehydrogenase Mo-binding subunit